MGRVPRISAPVSAATVIVSHLGSTRTETREQPERAVFEVMIRLGLVVFTNSSTVTKKKDGICCDKLCQ